MSKSDDIEEKIKEKRTLEANQKGLMGKNGKVGTILKILGQPIINQSEGGTFIDSNYIDLEANDYKNLEDYSNSTELMRNIPIMDCNSNDRPSSDEWDQNMPDPQNFSTTTIGMHFDGLSRGLHLEIKYDEYESELVVYYKGYIVYKEIKGELINYVPLEEWHNHIEHLYKISKEKQRKIKEIEFEQQIKQNENRKQLWWNKIKEQWGIN